MAIVTRVHSEPGLDPTLKKVGIITLEDILEELLQEEIEDEREVDKLKNERAKTREKIIYAFSDRRAKVVLN